MTTINDLERLLKSFINAAGYDVEEDRKIDGDQFYVISKKKKIVKEKEDNPDFTKFWFLYPRKTNCEKAKLSFNKLTKSEIILALHDIKTRYEGVEKQFIPHATTYIKTVKGGRMKELSQVAKKQVDQRLSQSCRKSLNITKTPENLDIVIIAAIFDKFNDRYLNKFSSQIAGRW